MRPVVGAGSRARADARSMGPVRRHSCVSWRSHRARHRARLAAPVRPGGRRAAPARPRAGGLVRLAVARPAVAPDLHAARVGDGDVGRARPASPPFAPPGPGDPVTATARSAPRRARTPSAIARAACALTAPCAARIPGGNAEQGDLRRVGVGDHAAQVGGRRAGDVGQGVADQASGARLGRRDRQAGAPGSRCQEAVRRGHAGDRAPRPDARLSSLTRLGGLPGSIRQVPGLAVVPSAPYEVPFTVTKVVLILAGPQLDHLLAAERDRLAGRVDLAADARVRGR